MPKQALQQLGRVARIVFAHQPRAIDIDRARADLQHPPDLLAGLAGHQLRGDFAFARRQFDRYAPRRAQVLESPDSGRVRVLVAEVFADWPQRSRRAPRAGRSRSISR